MITTFRIVRREGGSNAKFVINDREVELTPAQMRALAEALASMAADIERERKR